MVWYSCLLKNFPQFFVIHTVKGFGVINKAKVDVFLESSCFFDDNLRKPDSILKSRDITLPTKVHLVKAMVFPVVMYGCESWTVKKAEY